MKILKIGYTIKLFRTIKSVRVSMVKTSMRIITLVPATPTGSFILRQDGGYLLRQDGGKFIRN